MLIRRDLEKLSALGGQQHLGELGVGELGENLEQETDEEQSDVHALQGMDALLRRGGAPGMMRYSTMSRKTMITKPRRRKRGRCHHRRVFLAGMAGGGVSYVETTSISGRTVLGPAPRQVAGPTPLGITPAHATPRSTSAISPCLQAAAPGGEDRGDWGYGFVSFVRAAPGAGGRPVIAAPPERAS